MRIVKLASLALLMVAAVSMPRPASATSYNFTQNNLGVSGSIGSVAVTGSGQNVTVTITMKPGYEILTGGGLLGFDLKGGLKLTSSSVSSFSVNGMSGRLLSGTNRGGFTFSQLFQTHHKGGQLFVSSLSFTIRNATVSQIAGLGIHFCVVSSPGCSDTGFAMAVSPVSAVPEPGTLGLLGTGLVGIASLVRRRMR